MKKLDTPDSKDGPDTVLQEAVLQQYAKRRTGLLERLIAAYLEEAPSFHQNIRIGATTKNAELIKLNAHSLKSSSHNMGAIRLAKLCQEIESLAGANALSDVSALLARLGPECFEVEEALKSAVFTLTGKTLWDDAGMAAQAAGSASAEATSAKS